jgi:hypothetical protein
MKRMNWALLGVVALMATLSMSTVARAAESGDEARLQKEETEIDKSFNQTSEGRSQQLADQFGVEKTQVESIRSKTGWGGTTIQLSMAQKLMQTDPKTYPTMTDAIAKVDSMRTEGKGYGAIAKELGFKLGPVVSEARHVRNAARHEAINTGATDRPEKVRGERPDNMERGPKAERAPRAARPEKAHP